MSAQVPEPDPLPLPLPLEHVLQQILRASSCEQKPFALASAQLFAWPPLSLKTWASELSLQPEPPLPLPEPEFCDAQPAV